MARELLATLGYRLSSPRRRERIPGSRSPIPALITLPTPFYFIPRSRGADGPPRPSLIQLASFLTNFPLGERVNGVKATRGWRAPSPRRRANASLERDGNEIACCVPNSFSHRLALRAVGTTASNSATFRTRAVN